MELLILDGNPDPSDRVWEGYLEAFAGELARRGAGVRARALRAMEIRFCTGCWTCWWTTPGVCALKDDFPALYPQILQADVLVWASPLVLGNVSALSKKAQDRIIPLLHPYIELVRGECHHRRRYDKDIDMGLLVKPGAGDSRQDLEIVRHQHERLALNGRGRLRFFLTTAADPRAAADRALAGLSGQGKESRHETIGA